MKESAINLHNTREFANWNSLSDEWQIRYSSVSCLQIKMSRDWNPAAKLADMDTARYLFMCDTLARKRKGNIILQFRLRLSIIKDIHCGIILIDTIKCVQIVHNMSHRIQRMLQGRTRIVNKIKFHKVIVVCVILNGCEAWSVMDTCNWN